MKNIIIMLSLFAAGFGTCLTLELSKLNPLPNRLQLTGTIKRIQHNLRDDGYDVDVDGYYGSKTDDALFESETKRDIDDKFKRRSK